MRLAVYKQTRHADDVFNLAENLLTSIAGILTAATVQNQLVWTHLVGNTFSAEFFGLKLSWDQPNNEPPTIFIGHAGAFAIGHVNNTIVIQDDSHGFLELQKAIRNQYHQNLELQKSQTLKPGPDNRSSLPDIPIITCRT